MEPRSAALQQRKRPRYVFTKPYAVQRRRSTAHPPQLGLSRRRQQQDHVKLVINVGNHNKYVYIYVYIYMYLYVYIYTQNAIVAKNSRHGSQVPVEVSSRRSFRQLGGRIKRVANLPKFEMNVLVLQGSLNGTHFF